MAEQNLNDFNLNDWNRQIIEEFRTHEGKVGGPFEGTTLLLLTTTGARTGQKRINPLTSLLDGERLLIFAGNGGGPSNPAWYYNLIPHPQVMVQIGTEQFEATAAIVAWEEHEQNF